MWEQGDIQGLAQRAAAHDVRIREERQADIRAGSSSERAGKAACYKARRGAQRKAVMGFVGKPAFGTPEEREAWTRRLIPRSTDFDASKASDADLQFAQANTWGGGDPVRAKAAMEAAAQLAGCRRGTLPHVSLPNLTAPGRTGDRPEHLRHCLMANNAGPKRRLRRALDALTVQWATGTVSQDARWLLNTCAFWLKKQNGVSLDEEDCEWLLDVPEEDVIPVSLSDEGSEDDENGGYDGEGLEQPEGADQVASDIARAAQEPDASLDGAVDEASGGPSQEPRPTVRPIQMGEFLRKYITRRLQALDKRRIQCSMVNARQWGVGTPGGTEAIVHVHQCIEELYFEGSLPTPLAVVQVDQNNMFGNLEWRGIRDAMMDEVPHVAASTAWKHLSPSQVEQPDVADAVKDRGAEQGDAAAPLEAGATQAGIARRTRASVHTSQKQGLLPWCSSSDVHLQEAVAEYDATMVEVSAWQATTPVARSAARDDGSLPCHPGNRIQRSGGIVDVWYLDDGTVVIDPRLLVPYLRAFDAASDENRASRNFTKSNVIIYATEDVVEANAALWQIEELSGLAKVCRPEDRLLSLGAALGGAQARIDHFNEKTRVLKSMHEKIRQCENTQIEMVLSRSCLGLSKSNHLLRSNGSTFHREQHALDEFDKLQAATIQRLFPGTPQKGVEQARLCAAVGGLGFRSAVDTALPANIASRVLARPKVADLSAALRHAGLLDSHELLEHFDASTGSAVADFLEVLDEQERGQVAAMLEQARAAAEESWQTAKSGIARTQQPRMPLVQWSGLGGDESLPGDSAFVTALREADDRGGSGSASNMAHLQRELCLLMDNSKLRRLLERLRLQGDDASLRRLNELRDSRTCQSWLWHVDPKEGTVLNEMDFSTAVRHRLGAEFVSEPVACWICGKCMDVTAAHALCCAQGESTAGHYTVVRAVVDGLRVADSSVVTEVRGLVEDSSARPADVYTRAALPGRDAALDITVASQDAIGAGEDCCTTAFNKKLRKYARLLGPLARDGVGFRPMVWSSEGRPHPVVDRIINFAAELAARKHPDASAKEFAQRWRREIGVALQKRLARMVRACLPRPNRRGQAMLRGGRS